MILTLISVMDEASKNLSVQDLMKKFEDSSISQSINSNPRSNLLTSDAKVSVYKLGNQDNLVHSENNHPDKVRGIVRRPPVSRRPENLRLPDNAKVGVPKGEFVSKLEKIVDVNKTTLPNKISDSGFDSGIFRKNGELVKVNERLTEVFSPVPNGGIGCKYGNVVQDNKAGPDTVSSSISNPVTTKDSTEECSEGIPIPVPRKRHRTKNNNVTKESDLSTEIHTHTTDIHKKSHGIIHVFDSSEHSITRSSLVNSIHHRLKSLKVESKEPIKGSKLSECTHNEVVQNKMDVISKQNQIIPSNTAIQSFSKVVSNVPKDSQFPVSALPPGPPPEKPPRTFEHDLYKSQKYIASHKKQLKDADHGNFKVTHEYDEVSAGIAQKNIAKFEHKNDCNSQNVRIRNSHPVSHVKHKSLFYEAANDSVGHNDINFRNQNSEQESKTVLCKTQSDFPHYSPVKKKTTDTLVSPYAISEIPTGMPPKPPCPNPDIRPKVRSRSRFFVDLKESNMKRSSSDDHIYEEPHTGKVELHILQKKLVRTLSVDSEEFYIQNIEYDTITCKSNVDEDGELEGVRRTPNLKRGLHYLSSPINIQRYRTGSVSEVSSKNWNTRNGRDHLAKKPHDHRATPSRRVVPVAVRELINQSFHRVSNYQKNSSSLNPPTTDDDSGDSDCELTPSEVQERIEYIRTVSRVSSVKYDRLNKGARLFDYVLVVGLQCIENAFQPYIKLSYPTLAKSHFEKWVPHVSFPDAEFWKPSGSGETYMSVFTSETGKRTFGYCRRIKPDGSSVSLPVVYCIISPVMDFNFFKKLLQEMEKMHGYCDADMLSFLKHLHQKTLPKLGAEITIKNQFLNSNEIVRRSENPAVDSYGLDMLLSTLDVTNLVKVFASLLLERKVLLHSSSISRLSQCVQGLYNLLYPFSWDHTYVPVLPGCAIEVLCSPMPFLIGILNDDIPKLQDIPVSEVLMVDLDKNRMQHEHGDELKVIPKKLQKSVIEALKSAKSISETSRSIMISEAFLRVFVETVGSYSNYIVTQQDGKKVFEKEPFCLGATLKSGTSFLLWFTETQMFYSFIDSHLDGTALPGLFDQRVQDYNEEMNNLPLSFRENIKEFGKKVKNIGEKLIGLKSPAKLETKNLDKVKQAEV